MQNKHFNCRPARTLSHVTIAMHLLVFVILCLLPLAWLIKIIFLLLTIGSLGYCRYNDNKALRITQLHYCQADQWQLKTQQGEVLDIQLRPQKYLSDFLLILRFQTKTQTLPPILLFKTQFLTRDWRQLQMLLRMHASSL